MGLTRRRFIASAGVLAACGLARRAPGSVGQPSADTSRHFEWIEVRPGVHAAIGEGGNALLCVRAGRSALVDCKLAAFGITLRREAEAFGSPVRAVFNTHHHADHSGGNHAFTADLPVIAHANAAPRVESQFERYTQGIAQAAAQIAQSDRAGGTVRGEVAALAERAAQLTPASFIPRQLVGDSATFDLGGERFDLHHFGPGHTDNDLVIHLPGTNVLHPGDLLFHRRHPFIDRAAGATTLGWIAALEKAAALCDASTVVIPGHGAVTDVSGLRRQAEYFHRVREAVGKVVAAGGSADEAAAIDLPVFEGYEFAQSRERALRAVFEELSAPAATADPAGVR